MITNTRLLELRATADKCQSAVNHREATTLSADYVELYDLFKLLMAIGEEGIATPGLSLELLVGR